LFKIVTWVDNGKVKASAYLMPHMIPDKNAKFTDFATTVDEIEAVTGLDFFTTAEHGRAREFESGFFRHFMLIQYYRRIIDQRHQD
jgi:DNA/RNA endonuclease G (NUC1)